MASDRARISFDPSRDYRSVVAQQGRVTLDGDFNEAADIATEALRLETIDIVGPTGTPDDGYKVSATGGAATLTVGAGIMYLGGWRLTLDAPVLVDAQPDWLDRPNLTFAQTDAVSLLITEQSVCAVEDQALREVALGGPDSAARKRLMQHFLLIGMDGSTCADGAAVVSKLLAADGVTLDPYSFELLSSARLEVGFVPPSAPPDPCSPAAAGGYLGADNQLVRVTVTAFDQNKGAGSLLWGWNNASFLYRATSTDPAGVLTLTSVPVDQEHAPQLGQAVEILRSRADLGDGNFIAADSGFVTTVSQAYSFDTGTLTLASPLPAEYLADANPLFVRLWQAIVPFQAGQATALDTVSGLTVTLAMTALPTAIAARPFWRFAVRPNTPVQVYPARYQEAPQPPDGPRQWLCDLAVVEGNEDGVSVIADCRVPFNPLTDQAGGCCALTLDPAGVDGRGGIQAVLDALGPVQGALSLKPGTYTVSAPIVLTDVHNGITLEGCSGGVILQAAEGPLEQFLFGLIIVEKARDVTLRNLDLMAPIVQAFSDNAVGGGATTVAVMSVHTINLVVDGCNFAFTPGKTAVLGGGIVLLEGARGLRVTNCQFVSGTFTGASTLYGVLAPVTGQNVATTVEDAAICGCHFQNLNAGVLVFARMGLIRCATNRVRGCAVAFYFADVNLGAANAFGRQALGAQATDANSAYVAHSFKAGMKAQMLADTASGAKPLFARAPTPARPAAAAPAVRVLKADMTTAGQAAWTTITTPAADTAAAAEAQGAKLAAAKAAPRATQAAQKADIAYGKALDALDVIAVAGELAAYTLASALHIQDNDVTLVSPGATPGIGIGVIFGAKGDVGTVLMSGNRITTPDTLTAAAALLFPAVAAVNGNVMLQPSAFTNKNPAPAFILFTAEAGLIAVAGNVIRSSDAIFPTRSTAAATGNWDFLNTVR